MVEVVVNFLGTWQTVATTYAFQLYFCNSIDYLYYNGRVTWFGD
jgi:hypothetical protein